MGTDETLAFRAWVDMYRSAGVALGTRNRTLVFSYGRVMSGPHGGRYVSGIPASAVLAFIDALLRGEEIPVHLMHRHVSGQHESSRLKFDGECLWMQFADRTELA